MRPHLTFPLKGFVVGSQILNLTPALSFDHNSCKSGLNEQSEGTLHIYVSRPFNGTMDTQFVVCLPFQLKL
jgi:hypothetical protein